VQAPSEAVEIRPLVQEVVERRPSRYQVVEKEDAKRINNGVYMSSGIHDIDHKFYADLISMDDYKRSKLEKTTLYNISLHTRYVAKLRIIYNINKSTFTYRVEKSEELNKQEHYNIYIHTHITHMIEVIINHMMTM
jgi:hypothetical protein